MATRKEYFADKITDYLAELNKVNINAQAYEFNQDDYRKYLNEWDDLLNALRDCSNEFAKENLK